MDPDQEILQIGSILDGRYRILSCEGRSGNSWTFKAQHQLMGRNAAIKVLDWKLKDSQWNLKRFENQARMLAGLDHPNIVALRDFGVLNDGLPYLVTDYLEGKSLAAIIKEEGVLSTSRAVGIFSQLCDGLQYIHKQGIISRDFEPGKIMLVETSDGGAEVKIVDFGMARFELAEGQSQQGITKTVDHVGSPLWMSPEQLAGRPLDQRSDIYSLGCVMYEALSGKPPFEAEQLLQAEFREGKEKPRPIKEIVPETKISSEFESLIRKSLEVEPEKRYKSIEDLRSVLQAIPEYKELFQDRTRPGENSSKSGKVVRKLALVAVSLMVSAGALIWYVSTDSGSLQLAQVVVGLQQSFVRGADLALLPGLKWLVDSYVRNERYLDAVREYGRIVQITEAKFGQDSTQAIDAHVELGLLYCRAKQFKDGINELNTANKTIQKMYAAGTPESADAYTHVGTMCLHVQGAEDWFAYFFRMATVTHMTLAHKYQVEGNSARALVYFKKAVNDLETVVKQLPQPMMDLNQASVYCSIGRLSKDAEAERAYDAALDLIEKHAYSKGPKSGKIHYIALQILTQIEESTSGLAPERKADLGVHILSRALEIRKKALGPDDISVAQTAGLLGGIYEGQISVTDDRPTRLALSAKARDNFNLSLEIYAKLRGPDDPDAARIINSLADCENKVALFDDAQKHYGQVIEIAEKHPESLHDLLRVAVPTRAGCLVELHRFPEAEEMYKKAVEMVTKEVGPESPELVPLLAYLANCEYKEGKRVEALQHCRRALYLYKRGRAAWSRERAMVMEKSAELSLSLLRWMGQTSEADQLEKGLGMTPAK